TVNLKPDLIDEPNETILAKLTSVTPGLPGGFGLGTPQTAVISILDNDTAGTIQLASTVYSVAENAGVATIAVKRSGGTAGGATVQYAATAGTAIPGASPGGDFTPVTGTVTFGPGETVQTFTVPITDDGTPEQGKSVILTLSNPGYGVKLAAPSTAV